jgi:hypothetical protein
MGYCAELFIGYLLPETSCEAYCEADAYNDLFAYCLKIDVNLRLYEINEAFEGHQSWCQCDNTWFIGYPLKEHESPQMIYDLQTKLESNTELKNIVAKINTAIQIKVVGFGGRS